MECFILYVDCLYGLSVPSFYIRMERFCVLFLQRFYFFFVLFYCAGNLIDLFELYRRFCLMVRPKMFVLGR